MSDRLIIRGGLIADGTGGDPYEADLAVEAARVAEIGANLKGSATLDAGGAVVAPGFIDMHTHYDAQLFWDPACTPSSWHGVTSVIVGNCGFAIAPCRPENREKLIQMLVDLEDMPADVLNAGIDWTFTSFAEYLRSVQALRPSLNVGAYVGHSPLRIDVMGADAYERPATDAEIERMAAMVRAAMEVGAVGFASSSAPTGRRSATGKADVRELTALGRAMGAGGHGVMALVPGGESLPHERMYQMQADVGRPVTWTALMTTEDGRHRENAAMHRARYRGGARMHPQVSCRPLVAMSTLRSAFALRAPSMLALDGKTDGERTGAFRDPAWRARVAEELHSIRFPIGWDRWEIAESATSPQCVGWTAEQLATERGTCPLDAVLDLVLEDQLKTRFSVRQANYHKDDIAGLLNLEGAVLGLADSGAHPDQICDSVLPTDLLGNWVREKKALPLGKAIRKLTGELADLYGLDRGYIAAGAPADITVFDPATIAPGPIRRVADQPAGGERLIADGTVGLRHVLVNGVPIRQNGEDVPRSRSGGTGQMLRPVRPN